jgi:DNA-directed RNA polymerase subunit RPC12/RpoP
MPICPAGHDSESSDFCSRCGARLQAPVPALLTATADPPGERCPQCGTAGSGHFCETCGFDFAASASGAQAGGALGPARAGPDGNGQINGHDFAQNGSMPGSAEPGSWTAVVGADLLYYENVISSGAEDAARVPFPAYCTERRFQLTGTEMRIGRRSASRGLEPEIDLTGPPTDSGVSRLHAVLIAGPNGWAILDPGSENGTLLNDQEIATGVPVTLVAGDCIHLGAWTMIRIQSP